MATRENKRYGIMLCHPFEEKRLSKWNPPYIVQPKLDGERCRAIPNINGHFLVSSEENIFNTVPHIIDAIKELRAREYVELTELDGELYNHGMSFEEIHSIVSSQRASVSYDSHKIQYHIFDIINQEPQYTRIKMLKNLNLKHPLVLVPSYIAYTLDEVLETYRKILDQGYEGIVVRELSNMYVRKRSTSMMKFKPKKEDSYVITGWKEEVDKYGSPKGTLGAFICQGSDGTDFSVGSGLTDEDRKSFWNTREDLVGKVCRVQYQHITPGRKVPRFPVFVEVQEPVNEVNPLI
jgi:ATP-dependent DNA ligase